MKIIDQSIVRIHLLFYLIGQSFAESVFSKCDSLLDSDCLFNRTNNLEIFWFTHMPSLPLLLKNTSSLSHGDCKNHLNLYSKSLENGVLWAIQMFDSSVKNIYGTIDGHTTHLGSFDQCYRISVRNHEPLTQLNGRYCLIKVEFKQKNDTRSLTKLDIDFDPYESVWEAIKERNDFRRIKRYIIRLALCVPSSCTAKDVEQVLQKPISAFGSQINLNINLTLNEEECHSREDEKIINIYGQIFCFCLILWILLIVYSTYCDLSTNEDSESSDLKSTLIRCLSIRRNFKAIFSINYSHRGLDTIHFVRLLFMLFVISGHNCLQYFFNPMINARSWELTYTKPFNIIFHNGTVIIDGFFGISGLLMAYHLLQNLENKKELSYFKNIIKRYIRLTPAYLVVLLFNALILPCIGEGPYWKRFVTRDHEYNCKKNWWSNLLYINNYINSNEICMLQSWYLSVNFQCSLVTPMIIYVFWKVPRKVGYTFLVILVCISIIPSFLMSYVYDADPFLWVRTHYRVITDFTYFYDYYMKTHMRLTPYLVGLIVGVFIYDYNFARWRLPKIWSQILIIVLGPMLGFYILLLGYQFLDPNVKMPPLKTALYAGLHRGGFALCICSVIVLLTVGDGLDVHYKLLNCGWMQPFSKLTFCAFIMHNVLQTYRMATVRTARNFTSLNLALWDLAPEMLWCFVVSLIMAIVVEVPFRNMEKEIIFKRSSKVEPNTKKIINGIKKID